MDVNFHVELVTNDPLRPPFHNRQTKAAELEVPDISVNCTNHVSSALATNRVKCSPTCCSGESRAPWITIIGFYKLLTLS